jgi:hAT family C-terminal dimerisation region
LFAVHDTTAVVSVTREDAAIEDSDDDLYSFIQNPAPSTINRVLADELAQYLSSAITTTDCLQLYPAVGQAYVKANSTLPSSAAVERLFSAAGQILCSRRCKLSDDMCDMLLFLRDRLKKC